MASDWSRSAVCVDNSTKVLQLRLCIAESHSDLRRTSSIATANFNWAQFNSITAHSKLFTNLFLLNREDDEIERTKMRYFLFHYRPHSVCFVIGFAVSAFSLRAIFRRRVPELIDLMSHIEDHPFKNVQIIPEEQGACRSRCFCAHATQFKIQCRPQLMLQRTPLLYQPTVMH